MGGVQRSFYAVYEGRLLAEAIPFGVAAGLFLLFLGGLWSLPGRDRGRAHSCRGNGLQQPGAEGLQPGVEQVLLGGEVVEQRRRSDVGQPRHLGHRHPLEAAVGEQPPGGLGEQLAGLPLLLVLLYL